MKRIRYRNADDKFFFESDIEQFNFDINRSSHLKIEIKWNNSIELSSLERVNIYLKDHTLYENIFVVNSNYFFYYEESWYYDNDNIRVEVPIPKEDIFQRFSFDLTDIKLIMSNNNPAPAKFDFQYWIMPFKPISKLDSPKSIRKNIFINLSKWRVLPEKNIIFG